MKIGETYDTLLMQAKEADGEHEAGGLAVILERLDIPKEEIDLVMEKELPVNVDCLATTGVVGLVPLLIESFAAGVMWEKERSR